MAPVMLVPPPVLFSMVFWRPDSRALSYSTPRMTPDEMITGRKNTARTRALPLNFWFSISATKKLNTMMAKELTTIFPSCSVSIRLNSVSTVKALL
jgi:hypothetical protein